MSIKAIEFARTKNILDLNTEEMAGLLAGICYMKDDFNTLVEQAKEQHEARGKKVAESGHHSCYSHEYVTLILSDVPKIVAMMLNSLRFYNTSEKSGRYTVMDKCSEREKVLYDKWRERIAKKTKEYYPFMSDADADKRGKENARKMLSVFTPTVMSYSTSIQQRNYIIDWCDNFNAKSNKVFYTHISNALQELKEAIMPYVYLEGVRDNKDRGFDFIEPTMEPAKPYFGTVYNAVYKASFDEVAQCERHRVLELMIHHDGEVKRDKAEYSVPPILDTEEEREEWLKDITSLANIFPTGQLVLTEEKGTFMGWRKSKCLERDCGQAQLEIMRRNDELHKQFEKHKNNLPERERKLLDQMPKRVRCSYPDFKCTHPCVWGPKVAKERLV